MAIQHKLDSDFILFLGGVKRETISYKSLSQTITIFDFKRELLFRYSSHFILSHDGSGVLMISNPYN